jgi:hypothetical protein
MLAKATLSQTVLFMLKSKVCTLAQSYMDEFDNDVVWLLLLTLQPFSF